jgi:hypothetical protein
MWLEDARKIFAITRPEDFGDFDHRQECAEYNQILKSKDLDNISSGDLEPHSPMYFCSDVGKKLYIPALIRICLENSGEHFYFSDLLDILESNGKDNSLFTSCHEEQREFENSQCTHEAFGTYEVWS